MTDIEKIRSEVERLRENTNVTHYIQAFNKVLTFIDSLQEEPVSENLKEELDRYTKHLSPTDIQTAPFGSIEECARHFAGWQKEQDKQWLAEEHKHIFNNGYEEGFEHGRDDAYDEMMKDAIDGEIFDIFYPNGDRLEVYANIPEDKFEGGDKVKLIIIKED